MVNGDSISHSGRGLFMNTLSDESFAIFLTHNVQMQLQT